MKTIQDVFAAFKHGLRSVYEANELEAITLLAVSEISGLSKAKIKAFRKYEISLQQAEKLTAILGELKTGKPVQYILGETEFYGLPFKVNPSVLIPRPETEELVEWVLSSVGSGRAAVVSRRLAAGVGALAVGSGQWAVGRILDIGTGSGCIAISLKKHLAGVNVSAIDISAEALNTAKENARINEVDVDFIEADILNLKSEPDSYRVEIPKFEIIISNPPYVTPHDKTQMHQNVTGFEPHTALFVPEDDPLVFYKAIADYAKARLAANGLLFFEINESYGEQVVKLLTDKSFKNIELRKDMSSRHRMIRASLM